MWRQRVKTALYQPKRKSWNRSFPLDLQKEPTLPTYWSWISSFQTVRKLISLLSHPGCGSCYGSPSNQIHICFCPHDMVMFSFSAWCWMPSSALTPSTPGCCRYCIFDLPIPPHLLTPSTQVFWTLAIVGESGNGFRSKQGGETRILQIQPL